MEKNHQDNVTPRKMDQNGLRVSTFPDTRETLIQKPTEVTSSAWKENQIGEDEENHGENSHKLFVLYC